LAASHAINVTELINCFSKRNSYNIERPNRSTKERDMLRATNLYNPVSSEFGSTYHPPGKAAIGCLTKVLMGLGCLVWVTAWAVRMKRVRKSSM